MDNDRRDKTGSYIWSVHVETRTERKLSEAMRKAGLEFGQEVPVKSFTVDFLVDQWLVIEVDGESHLLKGRPAKDASRQKIIEDAGFTVMRIPAGDLSSDTGVKRWLKRIREKVATGPPYLNQERSANQDYLRQIEEAKKALRIGEAERKKREALAFGDSVRGSVPGHGKKNAESGESMEDYFGQKAEDFGALLKGYEWDKGYGGAGAKDDDGPRHGPRSKPQERRGKR